MSQGSSFYKYIYIHTYFTSAIEIGESHKGNLGDLFPGPGSQLLSTGCERPSPDISGIFPKKIKKICIEEPLRMFLESTDAGRADSSPLDDGLKYEPLGYPFVRSELADDPAHCTPGRDCFCVYLIYAWSERWN